MSHKQTSIKVNANVDCGIAPLVAALNLFPDVVTLSSCEGNEHDEAYVCFITGDKWQQIGEFLEKLSLALRKFPDLCDRASFSLCLEWYTGGEVSSAYLRVPHKHIENLAKAVEAIAATTLGGPECVSCLVARNTQSFAV